MIAELDGMTTSARATRRAVLYDEFMSASKEATTPNDAAPPFDWSLWEIDEEEDMGMSPEHARVLKEVHGAITLLAEERGWQHAFISTDAFFGWVQDRSNVRASPDVYVLFDVPESLPLSWRTWTPGHTTPAFALEVASSDWRKEYDVNPVKYDQLGATELVIYDPHGLGGPRRGPLSRYLLGKDGEFEAKELNAQAVHSAVLDAGLIAGENGYGVTLRLSRDAAGTSIVPSFLEAVREARAEVEVERVERLRLEAELARLRARLDAATSG